MNCYPLFISAPEVIFILFIVIMIFGTDKLPEIARGLAKGITQVKQATNEIKSEIVKSADLDTGVVKEIKQTLYEPVEQMRFKDNPIVDEVNKVKEVVDPLKDIADDFMGPIKRMR